MYGVDQYRDVVRVYALMYAVAEIEHMTRAFAVTGQRICNALANHFRTFS